MSEQQQSRKSVAVWFEIPSADFERAVGFYQAIMQTELRQETVSDTRLAVFPYERPAISGAVVSGAHYRPGADGAVIYLNCDGKLDAVLGRVAAAGGRVLLPATALPEGMGRFAHILDTEGNRVGLHAVD